MVDWLVLIILLWTSIWSLTKFLSLHAILYDALGFFFQNSEKGPGYSYVLPCPVTNEYLGHVIRLAFCLYVKTFKSILMLKSRPVVLDFEGFWHKNSGFNIKELAVSTENYCDTGPFLPPTSFNILSSTEKRSYSWMSKYLHGLNWESGDYPCCYLQQIFDSIALRFLLATLYAKGTEKTEMLQKLLNMDVINLEISYVQKLNIWNLFRRHQFVLYMF